MGSYCAVSPSDSDSAPKHQPFKKTTALPNVRSVSPSTDPAYSSPGRFAQAEPGSYTFPT